MSVHLQSPLLPTTESRVVSIHQPHYFPWLGLIAKIACSDIFIVLDNVQFEKNGWQNRARYSTAAGLKFLTIPVQHTGVVSKNIPIRDIKLAEQNATAKHWKTLSQRYGKRPGWLRIAGQLKSILSEKQAKIFPLCQATTNLTLDVFNLKPKIVLASTLLVEGSKGDRIINLVKAVQATHYLSGPGAMEYLDPTAFDQAGLGLSFQEFSHPRYAQSGGGEFSPGAFALEWFIEDPDMAVESFHKHLRRSENQPPRCIAREA